MAINYIAILVATIASWIVGAAWYGVLGKHWMAALGWNEAQVKQGGMPVGPMVTSFVAELVMAVMLAGLIAHFGSVSLRNGLITGGACWLAFIATTTIVNNAFQKRSFTLSLIDGGHWLLVLLVQGAVIGLSG